MKCIQIYARESIGNGWKSFNNETIGKYDRKLITPPIEKDETKRIRGNGPSGEFRNQFP